MERPNGMDSLLGMYLLSRLLRDMNPGSGPKNDLELINKACKIRIYKVADKIAQGQVTGRIQVKTTDPSERESIIPMQDKWDFELGNRVKVKFPLAQFRYIQKNTIGWTRRLEAVHGESGYVESFHSQYDNCVTIHFPDILTSVVLYAGVLERDDNEVIEPSAWKVGDFVKTDEDEGVVKILQRGLPDIPYILIGKIGKVIATTPKQIFVTFDGLHSHSVHSALLRPVVFGLQFTGKKKPHPRGFTVGDKVSVISNLKALINNQKNHGGWLPDMVSILGKVVIISDLNGDGTIDVRYKNGRSWKINEQSVFRLHEYPRDQGLRDFDLKPNDKVKLADINGVEEILKTQGISLHFREILGQVAVIDSISDDMEAIISYNTGDKIAVSMSLLKKATAKEAATYENRRNALKGLKSGQSVMLDVGPPNYVREILSQSGAKKEVIDTLTKPAVLKGFIDENHVIIQSGTGCMYKINKKYVRIP